MKASREHWEAYWQGDDDHSWWLRPAPEVLEFIASQSPAERPDVLDLGCGLGRHAIAFARAGFSITASDVSGTAIARLAEEARRLSLDMDLRVCDALSEQLPEAAFDIVLAYNVIYHGYRRDLTAAIRRVRVLLRPDGLFYFTCPSREDGKYGFGREVAPHTYESTRSLTPGDIHYFADGADLDTMLSGFAEIERIKRDGHWDNRGSRQFHSTWHVVARKA